MVIGTFVGSFVLLPAKRWHASMVSYVYSDCRKPGNSGRSGWMLLQDKVAKMYVIKTIGCVAPKCKLFLTNTQCYPRCPLQRDLLQPMRSNF